MNVNQLYFSPTGSTKRVIELLAETWGGEWCAVDFSIPDKDYTACTFAAEDLCLIGVPSFGGRVPAVAAERLRQMKAAGTPAILVTTYGNRDFDDTLLELKEIAQECGFKVIGAVAAVTEHSIMHQFGTDRPDISDQKELSAFAKKIKQALESGAAFSDVAVKGSKPYREYAGLPMKPGADKNCNKCGACAKSCPVGAIPAEDPSETVKDRCITCMRCVSICPQQSRKLNPVILFAAGKKMQKSCGGHKENVFYVG